MLFFAAILLCSVNVNAVSNQNLPTKNQVSKLATLLWKDYSSEIDITLYKEIEKPPLKVEQIRAIVQDAYGKSEIGALYTKDNVVERDREIEQEINRILIEQESTTILLKRIRKSNNLQYTDQTKARDGLKLTDETPFEKSYVNGGDRSRKDYTHFSYDHVSKIASVLNNSTMWRTSNVLDFQGLPQYTAIILQSLIGTAEKNGQELTITPDAEKIKNLVLGKNEKMLVLISHEGNRDRIEIKIPPDSENPAFVLLCNQDDYTKIYNYEVSNPKTGDILFSREFDDYDEFGYPHSVTNTKFDEDGKLRRREHHAVIKVDLTPSFSEEIFKFQVPPGYSLVDRRFGTPMVIDEVPEEIFTEEISTLDEREKVNTEALVNTESLVNTEKSEEITDQNNLPNTLEADGESVDNQKDTPINNDNISKTYLYLGIVLVFAFIVVIILQLRKKR
jgi:hypothetical protein